MYERDRHLLSSKMCTKEINIFCLPKCVRKRLTSSVSLNVYERDWHLLSPKMCTKETSNPKLSLCVRGNSLGCLTHGTKGRVLNSYSLIYSVCSALKILPIFTKSHSQFHDFIESAKNRTIASRDQNTGIKNSNIRRKKP